VEITIDLGLGTIGIDANDFIRFVVVREVEDIDDDNLSFHPEMCHQVFNET